MNDDDYEEYLAHKDWLCNNPTKDELRFIDDSDIISSDNSEIEESNSNRLKKYNQLLPRAKEVQKLLHSIKPEINKIWRTSGSKVDFLKKYKEYKSGLTIHKNVFSSDDSDSEGNWSVDVERTIFDTSSSVRSRGNEIWKTGKQKICLQQGTESDLEIISSELMAKGQKRKHEGSVSEEGEVRSVKKTKTDESRLNGRKVKRKENSHRISCSESDGPEENSTRILAKECGNINKSSRNLMNTHLLSSESEHDVSLNDNFSSSHLTLSNRDNGEISNSDNESVRNSEEEISYAENTETVTSDLPSCMDTVKNKVHRAPKLTRELEEEVSKFSLLLDKDLIEKNDIWLLQCPSSMDCSALVGQKLSLGGSCRLSDGDRTYETYSYRDNPTRSATLAVPSEANRFNLCRIPISGNIIVEESIEAINNIRPREIISEVPNKVEFPENLRVRHPLLGIDFSKQPRTAERVSKTVSKKKKHSKNHRESLNGLAIPESPSIFTTPKKKKKKKDRDREDRVSEDMEQSRTESIDGSAVKKKRKHKNEF